MGDRPTHLTHPLVGTEFTHQHVLDPTWVPPEGGKYADAPKAVMVITSVTGRQVYYRYADRYGFPGTRGVFRMDISTYESTYGGTP